MFISKKLKLRTRCNASVNSNYCSQETMKFEPKSICPHPYNIISSTKASKYHCHISLYRERERERERYIYIYIYHTNINLSHLGLAMELQNLRAFVEDPLSSKAAAAFQLTILVLIVASCSSVILQTLPQFQDLTLFWLEATVTIFFTIELLLRLLVNYTLNFENVEILNLVFCFCEALII